MNFSSIRKKVCSLLTEAHEDVKIVRQVGPLLSTASVEAPYPIMLFAAVSLGRL